MKRFFVGAVIAAALLHAPRVARAQAVPPATTAKVFTAVDAVKTEAAKIIVTGIVAGDAAPSTWSAGFYYSVDPAAIAQFMSTCQTQALLAMTKPGQYVLEIKSETNYDGVRPYCKLSRVAP